MPVLRYQSNTCLGRKVPLIGDFYSDSFQDDYRYICRLAIPLNRLWLLYVNGSLSNHVNFRIIHVAQKTPGTKIIIVLYLWCLKLFNFYFLRTGVRITQQNLLQNFGSLFSLLAVF